jgi:predicted lipoprotein
MKKTIRYIVFLVMVALVVYNSVYFKRLDEVNAKTASFDAAKYAAGFWDAKLIPALSRAVPLSTLLPLLEHEKELAFDQYSHALGIGNVRYFLIKGQGRVVSVDENQVIIQSDSSGKVRIATEYIFGNAVRDASGAIDINVFENSMDFNNVSAEINGIIRTKVIPPFKSQVSKGDQVTYEGAIELNKAHPDLTNIEVIPIRLQTMNN